MGKELPGRQEETRRVTSPRPREGCDPGVGELVTESDVRDDNRRLKAEPRVTLTSDAPGVMGEQSLTEVGSRENETREMMAMSRGYASQECFLRTGVEK